MAVRVRDKVEVDVNIFTRTVTAVTNLVMEMLLEVLYDRKLDPRGFLELRKALEDAMSVWFTERTLRGIMLEVFLPGETKALEHWEFGFEYRDDPEAKLYRTPAEEFRRFSDTLKSLPSGVQYRIMARVADGAKQIPGWSPTTPRDITPTVEKTFGKFGYGHIFGKVFYKGGAW